MAYTHLNADDPSIESFRGVFLKIRRAIGTTAFGLNEIRLPPNGAGREHDEAVTGHEEVYVVLAGGGSCTVDGVVVPLGTGDYLRVDPAATRLVAAGAEGMRFLAIGAKPLDAYDGRETL